MDVSAQLSPPRNPVVIARLALTRLAETSLPPTPENYAREYRRAAGIAETLATPSSPVEESPLEGMVSESTKALVGIVENIGHTTSGLAVGIERFDDDLQNMFGEAEQIGHDGVLNLIKGLTASRIAVQKTVAASRLELDTTRLRLEQVTAELERSRAEARVDTLTGFVNRRGMEEIFAREIARSRRASLPLSVAIMDIDHFKRINDEHGHDVGDRALVHLATVVKSGLRETDVICRYGGEEFVIILPDSDINGALFVIDRLRVMVEKTPMLTDTGRLQIRFSAGVAGFSGEEDRDSLIKRADEACYAAKRAGRNRVLAAQAASG